MGQGPGDIIWVVAANPKFGAVGQKNRRGGRGSRDLMKRRFAPLLRPRIRNSRNSRSMDCDGRSGRRSRASSDGPKHFSIRHREHAPASRRRRSPNTSQPMKPMPGLALACCAICSPPPKPISSQISRSGWCEQSRRLDQAGRWQSNRAIRAADRRAAPAGPCATGGPCGARRTCAAAPFGRRGVGLAHSIDPAPRGQ